MPFKVVDLMEGRRALAYDVLVNGCSLSESCRRYGVTRVTGRKWVERAREFGISEISEFSRVPKRSPLQTSPELESALIAMKHRYPEWGPKKLVVRMEIEMGLTLSARTASHVLHRRGLTSSPHAKAADWIRFERQSCGALLQADFKGLPRSAPYALLSVLDAFGRYCFAFEPVKDKTSASVQNALRAVFAEHGVPAQMLMDNGDCWGSVSKGPTAFEAWLMRLGIFPSHGKPGHPQTQGKVERFHLTAKHELKERLVQPNIEEAREVLRPFVDRYNWVRPHESLGQEVPGSRYTRFPLPYDPSEPPHQIPPGAQSRVVDDHGFFSYKGNLYRIGKGLTKERVVIKEDEFGLRAFYADFPLAYLSEL